MFEKINEFRDKPESKDRIILFTGHSLGGGLSKVLANKYEFQSVAFKIVHFIIADFLLNSNSKKILN